MEKKGIRGLGKLKHYLSHENKIDTNWWSVNILRYIKICENIYVYKQQQKQWKHVFQYVKLTDQLLFKINFKKCLINGTKHHKDSQLHSLELPFKISWLIL